MIPASPRAAVIETRGLRKVYAPGSEAEVVVTGVERAAPTQ